MGDLGLAAADPALDRFAGLVRTALGVPVALVSLVDPHRHLLPGAAGLGEPWQSRREVPLDRSLCRHVAAGGRPLVVSDVRADHRWDGGAAPDGLAVAAYAGVPLTCGDAGDVVGALCAIDDRPRRWSDRDLEVLTGLAGACSEMLRLRVATRLADTAAATLQKALLTDLPKVGPLRIAARYQPAHRTDDVGGDWYDAVALPDGRLGLVIGDVTGHNLDAAARMSELRSMLRGFLIDRHEPPSALLRRLDHANRALGAWTIASVLAGFLDPDPAGGHTLWWANAGHPPPVLLLPDGTVIPATPRDTLIGVRRQLPRRSHTVAVPPGATLLLHTDGLVEARGSTLDEGNDRLRRLLAGHARTDLDELAEVLLAHAAQVSREDDVALLLVRTPQ